MELGTPYTSFRFTKDDTDKGTLDCDNATYFMVIGGMEVSRNISQNWKITSN